MNWTDQWVKLLGACVSVSTGAAAIRDLRGVPKKVKRAEIDKKAESKEPEKSEDVDPEISAAKRKLKEGQSTEDLKDKKAHYKTKGFIIYVIASLTYILLTAQQQLCSFSFTFKNGAG